MMAWGWRIPFLIGIPLTLWIYRFRQGLVESSSVSYTPQGKNPFSGLFILQRWALLKGISLCAFSSVVGAYLLYSWMPFYLIHFLQYPKKIIFLMNTWLQLASVLFRFAAAYLAGRIGSYWLVKASVLLTLLLAYPLFLALQGASLVKVGGILLILNVLLSSIGGVIIEVLGQLFPHTRATGMSIAFTLPTAILGGLTPLVLNYMTDKTGLLLFPAFYILFFALLALPAALRLEKPRAAELEMAAWR